MYRNNTLYLWKRKVFRENVENNQMHYSFVVVLKVSKYLTVVTLCVHFRPLTQSFVHTRRVSKVFAMDNN